MGNANNSKEELQKMPVKNILISVFSGLFVLICLICYFSLKSVNSYIILIISFVFVFFLIFSLANVNNIFESKLNIEVFFTTLFEVIQYIIIICGFIGLIGFILYSIGIQVIIEFIDIFFEILSWVVFFIAFPFLFLFCKKKIQDYRLEKGIIEEDWKQNYISNVKSFFENKIFDISIINFIIRFLEKHLIPDSATTTATENIVKSSIKPKNNKDAKDVKIIIVLLIFIFSVFGAAFSSNNPTSASSSPSSPPSIQNKVNSKSSK